MIRVKPARMESQLPTSHRPSFGPEKLLCQQIRSQCLHEGKPEWEARMGSQFEAICSAWLPDAVSLAGS